MRDIRAFIELLEERGQLRRIVEEVDWNLEVGAISRRACELRAPALLFEHVKDYPDRPILANPLATMGRLALAMGMDEGAGVLDIIEEYIRRMQRPIKPVEVQGGPCKEEVHLGEEADVLEFPAPLIHQGDGGRYLGTWHLIAVKDPDSGWVNWGMYRMMVLDRHRLGGIFVPTQHGPFLYFQKYEPRGVPMPFAVAIGTDPLCALVACNPFEYGVNEVDVAGGFRGAPVELVRCETVDLYVPAASEIVIEGEVLPGEREPEGPFGEYTGYMAGGRAPRPVYRVKAITHRRRPILTMSNMGMPLDDSDVMNSVGFSAAITLELRRKGFPLRAPALVVPECSLHLVAVSTAVPYAGIARQIAQAIWSDKCGQYVPYVIVCDGDVDISSRDAILHALATRCHPVNGIEVTRRTTGNPLTPFYTPEERRHVIGHACLFDCTWPTEWPPEAIPRKMSFESAYPPELQQRVLARWRRLMGG